MIYQPSNELTSVAWEPVSLRFTVFMDPNETFDSAQWWTETVGKDPDSQIIKNRSKEFSFEGEYLSGMLQLVGAPSRIDWRYTVVEQITSDQTVATLGSLASNYTEFFRVVHSWLTTVKLRTITRLALGGVLLQPVDDLQSAYVILAQYLHNVKIDVDDSSDFLFQVNRPRGSKTIPNLRLNRLCKWAALRVQAVELANPMSAFQPDVSFASHLELDINSDKENLSPFSAEQLLSLHLELTELFEEITIRGDVK